MNTFLTQSQQKRRVICFTELKLHVRATIQKPCVSKGDLAYEAAKRGVRSTNPGANIIYSALILFPTSGWIYVWVKLAFKPPSMRGV